MDPTVPLKVEFGEVIVIHCLKADELQTMER